VKGDREPETGSRWKAGKVAGSQVAGFRLQGIEIMETGDGSKNS